MHTLTAPPHTTRSSPVSLYHPDSFRDNCGFGLIAHRRGEASHALLQTAIAALTRMTHRGGINADGKTGDGCGLLLQKPDAFLRAVARETFGVELPQPYAVGMVFFNPDVLGPLARAGLPRIEQVFIGGSGLSEQDFAIKLFSARRRSSEANAGDREHYVCSFSHTTLVYKGLMMPKDLAAFYPDLADARLETAICVFHQRFSTNTSPRWRLAHPYRMLAHNGEINTITGNRNWVLARRSKFANTLIPDLDQLGPLVKIRRA